MRIRFFALIIVTAATLAFAQEPPYKDASQPVAARVADLLSRMTLAEKIGQITQIDVASMMGESEWDRGPLNEAQLQNIFEKNQVGSILSGGGAAPIPNTPKAWAEMTNQLQDAALKYSRLGIPYLYGIDAVHGHNNVLGATLYPHNVGLGAAWNPALAEKVAAQVAKDLRAVGTPWTFAPVADVARDARWGRFYESFGESPLLTSELTAASVRGFEASGKVAATVKHFAGYGESLVGFDRSPAFLDLRTLRTTHLPSFAAGITAGAQAMMVNSGSVNGVPVHASPYLLQEVARNQLGFNGVIVSDWEDILKLVTIHQVAKDFKEAVAMSINAGVDMYMVPHDADTFTSTLTELVKAGTVPQARIDDAVGRILALKFELGLFETPYTDAEAADGIVIEKDRSLARRAALESITLLERGSLPFDESVKNILVTGPSADSIANQMGGWTIGWQGIDNPSDVPPGLTVLEALEKAAPENVTVNYTPDYQDTEAVKTAASKADVAVVVVGETPYAEGEGNSSTLAFPEDQLALMRTLTETDTPVVVVLLAGRPLIFPEDIWTGLDGLVMAYLPGSEGGTALADVLYGKTNPSGKLPFSWPKHTGQLPLTYDVLPGAPYDLLYAFGYGLSYTQFSQQNLSAARDGETVNVSVEVENTGEMAGSETVQVYLSRPPLGVLTPVKELVGFAKVALKPGEQRTVNVSVPLERFAIIPGDILGEAEPEVLPGSYMLQVGQAQTQLEVSD